MSVVQMTTIPESSLLQIPMVQPDFSPFDKPTQEYLRYFLDEMKATEGLSLDEQREYSRFQARASSSVKAEVAIIDRVIIKNKSVEIPVEVYRPHEKNAPLIVYFHGGGWVYGSFEESEEFCRKLCAESQCVVASVEYRLAPECKFPGPLMDCCSATVQLIKNAEKIGADKQRAFVMGNSAGGNLAAATALYLRDFNGPKLAGQILISPITTAILNKTIYDSCEDQYFLTYGAMDWFWQSYLDSPQESNNPYASPLHASLELLPKAYIMTSEYDPLRAEGLAYAEALKSANVAVNTYECPKSLHDLIGLSIETEEKNHAFNHLITYLKASKFSAAQ